MRGLAALRKPSPPHSVEFLYVAAAILTQYTKLLLKCIFNGLKDVSILHIFNAYS